jgi:hypothetical protein
MNKIYKAFFLIIVFSILIFRTASSQITSSPYSIFGLGSIEESGIGVNSAMGGTGIAFMSGYSLNFQNPASYDGLDSLLTIFEVGVFGKYTSYQSSTKKQSLFDSNIKYALMGFRPTHKWALCFGIAPYSTIGYDVNVKSQIEGSIGTYDKSFTGEGGVNQVFLGNSYRITKNLILGINAVYLYGSVTHSESSETYSYKLNNVSHLSNFNLNYGLNYKLKSKDWNYDIGLIYNRGKRLTTSNETTITTTSESDILKSRNKKFKIPETYGLGLAFGKKLIRGGVDFELRKWNSIEFDNPILKTRNSKRVSAGIEIPSSAISHGVNQIVFFRLGAAYSQSYMVIDNVPINNRSVSMGIGIPTKNALSVFNISVELGRTGSIQKNLFRENYCSIHFDISLKDAWFMKKKYD